MSSSVKQEIELSKSQHNSTLTKPAGSASLLDQPTFNDVTGNTKYPAGISLVLIIVSLCSSVFLVALDATIIATAIPTITSQFNSLDDVSWYNSVFSLTTCAFQLPFGRAYSLFNAKWVFLSSIAIFEIGSVVCAKAPSSDALIAGRAIAGKIYASFCLTFWYRTRSLPIDLVAGVGGGGIFSGSLIIISQTVPLRKRSFFAGFLGATFGIASVVGPIIGNLDIFNSRLDKY